MSRDDFAAYYPTPNTEQQEKARVEESKVVASLPVIQDVLTWFDEQIASLKDPTLIDVDVKTDAEALKLQVIVNKQQAEAYIQQRDNFLHVFSKYLEVADAA